MRKKTDRELALEWWDKLDAIDKHVKQLDFGYNRNFNSLTGREIEAMWKERIESNKK